MKIRAVNLSKRFGSNEVLKCINFEVKAGQISALLGANGAGKTTILNLLVGFLKASGGHLFLDDLEITNDRDISLKNKIGYLTSGMSLYHRFTLRENLYYFGGLRELNKSKIDNRIENLKREIELDSILEKQFPNMSSGEKQKALLSQALLHDPEILIFDEITASLDVPTARIIMDYIKREKEKGKTIIFSTHILSEAEYVSDGIILLHHGRVLDTSSIEELKRKFNVNNLTDAFCMAVSEGSESEIEHENVNENEFEIENKNKNKNKNKKNEKLAA